MTITTRRSVSWVTTLAVIAGLGIGYTRLPGAGGLTAELRWMLQGRTMTVPPREANRLATRAALMVPDQMSFALMELSRDDAPFVTCGALLLWSDLMRIRDVHDDLATAEMAAALVEANDRLPPTLRVFPSRTGEKSDPFDEIQQWIGEERRRESGRATSQPGTRDG